MKNQIQHTFTDEKTKKSQVVRMQLTDHATERISQRNISQETIFQAMEYGKEIYKQGLVFYVVLLKNLPFELGTSEIRKLNNMVLVVDPNSAKIITCYKSHNGSKHIKRKAKRLSRNAA